MKKLAIIVPYRDRPNHLRTFVKYMTEFLLNNGGKEFEIFVVEQNDNNPFNRGKLLNIGSKIAIDEGFDYLCFHDVDLLPLDADYSYPEYPSSLISDIENKDGDILFRYFGGVTIFNVEDFKGINGYSNNYWGWGFEDDDLFHRVTHGGLYFDVEKLGVDNRSTFFIEIMEEGYVKLPIDRTFIDKDFTIEITARVKSKFFDENKDYDEYPIFCLPGYNIGLFYNSFNRYFFQIFDKDKTPYSITSTVLDDGTFTFKIVKRENRVSLYMDEQFIGDVEMESGILNMGNDFAFVGAFSDKEKIEFDMDLISLSLNDREISSTDMLLNDSKLISHELSHQSSIPKPVRRMGLYRELYHNNNSSIEKNWVHRETRDNQLFYNNIVKQNHNNFKTDGLNSLNYELVSIKNNKGYRKIIVKI